MKTTSKSFLWSVETMCVSMSERAFRGVCEYVCVCECMRVCVYVYGCMRVYVCVCVWMYAGVVRNVHVCD